MPLPLKEIRRGFLDGVRDHGIQAPDRIELVATDGLATLIVGEITTYGIGFSVLAERKVAKSFEPRRKAKASTPQEIAAREPDPGPVVKVTIDDLSPGQIANGWTAEAYAAELRKSGINAVASGHSA